MPHCRWGYCHIVNNVCRYTLFTTWQYPHLQRTILCLESLNQFRIRITFLFALHINLTEWHQGPYRTTSYDSFLFFKFPSLSMPSSCELTAFILLIWSSSPFATYTEFLLSMFSMLNIKNC